MTNTGKIAVVGDKDSVLAFRAAGFEVFAAENSQSANDVLRSLCKDGEYAVIFITEEIASLISDTLTILKKRAYPIVVPIPSANGSTGFGLQGIKKDVEKAIGADILFNK